MDPQGPRASDRPDTDPVTRPRLARHCRVLVVDDNVDAATMMQTYLGLSGHEVRIAHDALSALALLESFRAEIGLLDIGLPGMDGYELAQRIRAHPRTRQMYLVAITGWAQEGDRQRARQSGFDGHLTKPTDLEQVNRLIASRGGMAEPQS